MNITGKTISKMAALFVLLLGYSAAQADLALNGVGLYSDLRAKYYYGALYTENQSDSAKALLADKGPKKLEMRILADSISPRRFYKLFNEAIAINNSSSVIKQYSDEILSFTNMAEDRLQIGDTIVVDNSSGKTIVTLNGVEMLKFNDPEFVNVLLKGWIGRLPPTAKFKNDILGKSEDPIRIQGDFQALVPAAGRADVVKGWLEPEVSEKALAALAAATQPKPKPKPSTGKTEAQKQEEARQEEQRRKEEADRIAKLRAEQERLKKAREEERKRLARLQLVESKYIKKLISAANKKAEYPAKAYEREQEGYTKVRVIIKRNGDVVTAATLQSSDFSMLDRAAISAAEAAGPYPAVPADLDPGEETYEFTIPFRFALSRD